jgi:hypothetical protein
MCILMDLSDETGDILLLPAWRNDVSGGRPDGRLV